MIEYLASRKGILIFALALMLITCVPYLLGYQNEGADWRYTGFVIGVEDGNSYISKMYSGANGDWLFQSKHSTFQQDGVLAYFPYLLLGKLAAGKELHSQLVVIYHGFRFIAGFLSIVASYELVCFFIKDQMLRWWTIALITLGGGLGWVLVAISQKGFLGSLPLDFISPESFGFLGLFGFPHLAAARWLFVWGLYIFLVKKDGFLAGLIWLIMGFFQPMVGIVAWVIIGSYSVLSLLFSLFHKVDFEGEEWKSLMSRSLKAFLISAPIVFYTAWIFLSDPYFIAWNQQNKFVSPHPLHYLIGYGLAIPFTILGIRRLIKSKNQKGVFLLAWLFVVPFLVYAPLVSQRRLAEGYWICLIIGMMSLFDQIRIPKYMPYYWSLFFPTTVFLMAGSILQVLSPGKPLFRPMAEVTAYKALSSAVPAGSGVLSTFEIGNNLPARAPVRAVIGHGPETIGLADIQIQINAFFYESHQTEECGDFFDGLDVDYIFWGPEEQSTWKTTPSALDCVTEIYHDSDYRLFLVQ